VPWQNMETGKAILFDFSVMKKQLGKKAYYRIEAARIIAFPILLIIATFFFQAVGWISPQQAPIVWVVVAVETVANLAALSLIAFLEK